MTHQEINPFKRYQQLQTESIKITPLPGPLLTQEANRFRLLQISATKTTNSSIVTTDI